MTDDPEEWRPIAWAPDYEVSSLGRVRSWKPRGKSHSRPAEPRLLTLRPVSGSSLLGAKLSIGGDETVALVHLLVARAFIGAASAVHENGDQADNRAANLVPTAGTAESASLRHGGLCADEVREIRADEDASHAELARRYGISVSQIHAIRKGLSWRDIDDDPRPQARRRRDKLTPQQRDEIASSSEPGYVLAKRYGISQVRVSQVRRGR